ncbi:MAG TPA: hypothetical protein VG738_10255 [Chitinophagaceae bacterium]|nr:hypothetical protein [Chitinophagaceae bacterium]
MHFHKNLVITILVSIAAAIPAFALFVNKITPNQGPLVVIFGWMVWLTLFSILGPALVQRRSAKDWFTDRYLWGTVVLAIFHLVAIIFVSYCIVMWFHKW